MTRHFGQPGIVKGRVEIIERRHEEPWSYADMQENHIHEFLDNLADLCRTKIVRGAAFFWIAWFLTYLALKGAAEVAWGF